MTTSTAASGTATIPRVACIVITYNREDFVPVCVASLLREHGEAVQIEVTVINNGATDGTAEVLANIDDPRVTIRTNAVNTPIVQVLNDSLKIGHGSGADYILLLNDDIEMQPGAIVEMVEVCREVPHSIVTPLQINYRKPDEIDAFMLDRLRTTDAPVARRHPARHAATPLPTARADWRRAPGDARNLRCGR
jgi:GT2 family glycosyltransferase